MEKIRIIIDDNKPLYCVSMGMTNYLKVVVNRKDKDKTIRLIKEFLDEKLGIVSKE